MSSERRTRRILMAGRHDAAVAPGGGEIQLSSTLDSLCDFGIDARRMVPGEMDDLASRADCVHLFGSRAEFLPLVESARRQSVPVVLSTIAWYDWRDYWHGGTNVVSRSAAVARFAARAACPWLPSWRRRLYNSVDLLLPNSTAEARQLMRYFRVPADRIHVVPNGADPRFSQAEAKLFVDRYGLRDFVLCPGRIEPRKNQLGLIRALRHTNVPVVVLGQVVPGHEDYLAACRREANRHVRFIDRLDHDDPLLASAYAACGCLALVSRFETPGLVALEAAMSGTPLVLPVGGCAQEYFGPLAQYVQSNDYRGIREAVLWALAQGRSATLADHVRDNFSWTTAAAATREAYRQVIESEGTGGDATGCSSAGISSERIPSGSWGKAKRCPRKLSVDISTKQLQRRHLGRYRYVRLRWRIMFTLIDAIGELVFSLGRLFSRAKPSTGKPVDPRKILLVQLDHLGDAILSTGMISALRRRYPDASIEVLTGQWNQKLFEAIDDIDRLHVSRLNRFSRSGRFGWPAAVFWWGWHLRKRKFDLGIDVRGEFPIALILWLCRARRRVGWNAGGGGFLLTDSAAFVPHRAEIESRAALIETIGMKVDGTDELLPRFCPPADARRTVRQRLSQVELNGPLVVLHVSAGTEAKRWPIDHWRSLVDRLTAELSADIILVGSRDERPIARAITADRDWPSVHDWTGRCDLVELAALLERADVVVGADSGPVHLASAVGRPVVALFSGTNRHEQWQPPGSKVTVLRHPVECSPCHRSRCALAEHPCMSRLRPEEVAAAVAHVLKNSETPMPEMSSACVVLSASQRQEPRDR